MCLLLLMLEMVVVVVVTLFWLTYQLPAAVAGAVKEGGGGRVSFLPRPPLLACRQCGFK